VIAYASRTGNVRHIVRQLGLPAVEVDGGTRLSGPFLLITYTDGLGEVPEAVLRFMEQSGARCVGVVASGNRNFGPNLFGRAGDILAERWGIPLVRKIDLRGFPRDYEAIRRFFQERFGGEGGENGGKRREVVFAAQQ